MLPNFLDCFLKGMRQPNLTSMGALLPRFHILFFLSCLLIGPKAHRLAAQDAPSMASETQLRADLVLNRLHLDLKSTAGTKQHWGGGVDLSLEGPKPFGAGLRFAIGFQESWDAPWDSVLGGYVNHHRNLIDLCLFNRFFPLPEGLLEGNVLPFIEVEYGASGMLMVESTHLDGSDEVDSITAERDFALMGGLVIGVRLFDLKDGGLVLRYGSRIGGVLDQPSADPSQPEGPPLNGNRKTVSMGFTIRL